MSVVLGLSLTTVCSDNKSCEWDPDSLGSSFMELWGGWWKGKKELEEPELREAQGERSSPGLDSESAAPSPHYSQIPSTKLSSGERDPGGLLSQPLHPSIFIHPADLASIWPQYPGCAGAKQGLAWMYWRDINRPGETTSTVPEVLISGIF